MKIEKSININKSAIQVWQTLSDDFDKVYEWMAPVHKSYAIPEESTVEGAAVAGRICEFSDKKNGFYAEERITGIDHKTRTLMVEVLPKNAPKMLPIIKNKLVLKVVDLGPNHSKVFWITEPELKPIAKLMKPLVKAGLSQSFGEVLDELKFYMENEEVHPRKEKKILKSVA